MFDSFLLVADKDETGKEKQSPRQEDSPPTSPNDEGASPPAQNPSASPPPPPSDGGGGAQTPENDNGRGHPSPPGSYRSSGEEQERAASSSAAIGQPGAGSAASSLVPSPLDVGRRDSPSPFAAAASPEEENRAGVTHTGSGEVVTGPPNAGKGISCFL